VVAVAPAIDLVQGAVMFTDIVGFTEYTALEGDERALELLTLQERIVNETLPDGARIVKELGDGLLLWFPEACAAVDSALALLARFEMASREGDAPLWVRMGMHWGTAARRRDDIVGHDVNVAARIVGVAGPGELLVSQATIDAVNGATTGARFEPIGPVVMKGLPDAIRLYRAVPATDERWP
jgi:adenylate cyclase